jgi:hypothetical protein
MWRVGRVADAVRAMGGKVKTYTPRNFRSTPTHLEPKDVEANREWLRYWAKEKDALIIDIGPDPADVTNWGPFYSVERRSIDRWGPDLVTHDPGF